MSLSYYLPNVSGLTLYARNVAEELAKQGHEVTILTSRHATDLPRQETLHGVRIVRVPVTFRIGKGPIMLRFAFACLKYARAADVVNPHLPQLEGALLAVIARLLGKRVVATYHTDLAPGKGLVDWMAKRSIFCSSLLAGACAHAIITNTEDYAQHSPVLRRLRSKLTYVYPPVATPTVDAKVRHGLEARLGPRPALVLGFVGRIAAEKGLEYLLEAVPLVQHRLEADVVLIIAGPPDAVGEEAYVQNIRRLVESRKERVVIWGTVAEHELGAFYSLLDILVLPSVNATETFGMVQVEAMLCGAPVVASDLPGVRQPIRVTGMGELARARDPVDLAERIVAVGQQRENYIRLTSQARKLFSYERSIREYEQVLLL